MNFIRYFALLSLVFALSFSVRTNEGSGLDPHGTPRSSGEAGCGIDPNGGRCAGSNFNGDSGPIMDPNG